MQPRGGGLGKGGPEECSLLLKSQNSDSIHWCVSRGAQSPQGVPLLPTGSSEVDISFWPAHITWGPLSHAWSLLVREAGPPHTTACP